MKFTILGGAGFIGGAMARHLKASGHDVDIPPRNIESLSGRNLGHVIFAIGMTGNFREHTEATIDAHVNALTKLMKGADYQSWLYLSSARVYGQEGAGTAENTPISLQPNADTLYDLSKLLGEAVCLGNKNDKVRVVRLSNVFGQGQSPHTFLGSIFQDLRQQGQTIIQESPASAKDYVSVEDLVKIIEQIAINGRERLYNVASGRATTHQQIAEVIKSCGFGISFASNGSKRILPAIDIKKIKEEFGYTPQSILDDLPTLLKQLS